MMSEQIDLIIVAYNDISQGRDVIQTFDRLLKGTALPVATALVLEKDVTGKTTVTSTLDTKQKHGTRLGAVAGGLLMAIAPPVGAAGIVAGVVAGAVIGRKSVKESDKTIADEIVDMVLDTMLGDSSALVLLAEQDSAEQAEKLLAGYGGTLTRRTLTEAQLTQLVEHGAEVAGVSSVKAVIQEATRGSGPQFNTVHVIINPASGHDQPILNTLNTVLRTAGLKWDVSITHAAGDATRLAATAAASGVDIVAVYGGDGAVMEAATGLIGTGVPLAILPGGTNNVMSVELGISKDLVEAASLIGSTPSKLRTVDMGKVNDLGRDTAHHFILRVGTGYEAVINEGADRKMKDRYGGFAYSIAGLKALKNPPIANYHLVLDGAEVEMEGLWCLIANSASLGIPGVNLVREIDVGDGLLDVIIVRQADLESLVSVAGSVTNVERIGKPLPHWQVREATITADPPQSVTGDGELWEPTPLKVSVIPSAVQILVPNLADS
jgi:YegS/Rv2252/BmrU family lipid kinase